MHKGFVIFRDPAKPVIKGWKGVFSTAKELHVSHTPQFYIQPWNTVELPSVLEPDTEETDLNVLETWVAGLELPALEGAVESEFSEFKNLIGFIKTGIAQGDFEKIVAARCKTIPRHNSGIFDAFQKICEAYSKAFVYLMFHPDRGCWIGASPERFLFVNSEYAETVALAGTLIHQNEIWTPKEELEQNAVSVFLKNLFQKFDISNVQSDKVQVTEQGNLKHLSQNYRFDLPLEKFQDLVKAMHPTPAVGGFPQKEALLFIDRFENLNRELFTGWLGWSEHSEFNSWVNLRCAKVYSNCVQLFAGCGVNSGSDPEKEWLETEAKMQVTGRFF